MESIAPIIVGKDIPNKAYVDSKVAGGFSAYTGRWGPALISAEASDPLILYPNTIYVYRFMTAVALQSVGIKVVTAAAGKTLRILHYADASPWPGAQLAAQTVALDTTGLKTASMSIPTGYFWLAVHNIAGINTYVRPFIGPNVHSTGALNTTGSTVMASGISHDTGGTTSPNPWPIGTGFDTWPPLAFFLRAV